MFLAREN